MSLRYTQLRGLANGSLLRVAQFQGRDHLVVPVVALVGNIVVRPIGADGPEFVPLEVLADAPAAWNNRVIMPLHPDNGAGSANEPRTLEQYAFGQMFHTHIDNGALVTEAWLDPTRAAEVADAPDVIRRCQAGEMVEVSVGCFVYVEKQNGTAPNGDPYEYVWMSVKPDHLAMLPQGTEGACSVQAGCGAPRAAEKTKERKMKLSKGLLQRLLARIASAATSTSKPIVLAQEEGISDGELRSKLNMALRAVEPGFDGVAEVYQDSSTVIYLVAPEYEWMWVRRSYSIDAAGTVTLGDDREVVEPITKFEPVTMEGEDKLKAAQSGLRVACDCKNGAGNVANPREERVAAQADRNNTEGEPMSKKTALVGRLLAFQGTPFNEQSRATLEALSEERLTALADALDPQAPPVTEPVAAPAPVAIAPAAPAVEETEEQAIAKLPKGLRSMFKRYRAAEEARRNAQISALAEAQEGFAEAELREMSSEQLDKLSRALGLDEEPEHNYLGNGLPTALESDEVSAAPKPYDIALAARSKSA